MPLDANPWQHPSQPEQVGKTVVMVTVSVAYQVFVSILSGGSVPVGRQHHANWHIPALVAPAPYLRLGVDRHNLDLTNNPPNI